MARYALFVGIAQYDNFRNLDKAATDAAAIARLLQVHGQYQVEPLPKRLVAAENRWELATDKKLTGKDLGQTLETFLLDQANGHEALLYFAGHGFEVPGLGNKKKGYLATSDCTSDGRNAILFSDLNDLIRESSLSSLVVILDCCHAGSFLERTLLESTLTAFKEKKDYYLITACRSFERSREGEEHGVFTASVLKGLQAENADSEGAVTGDRLFDFVQRELRQSGQEPIRTGTGRSITLVTYQPQVKTVTATVDEHGEVICPYQGLQAFTAKQREFFFGRKRIVEVIKQKLEQQPFVPVIGASGSGKSSVVRAGLMPWLEESGWRILEPIKPGFEPLAALRSVFEPFLKRSRSDIQTLHQLIASASTGLSGVIERLPGDTRYLLVVDQFEEVFTVCANEAERRRFIDLITQVAKMQNSRLAVVTTMRADFLEPCLQYPSLHHLIQSQAVFMPPLTGVDLRDAITEPAKRQGYTLEESLLLQILENVSKEPGFLPLLEFALTKLWEKRDTANHLLTLEQYEKLGGLTGTLNLHADRVYHYRDYEAEFPSNKRTEQEQNWIKQIFLRLVRTGEGERDTRQRQPKEKLFAIAGGDSDKQEFLRELLDGEGGLIQGRLVVAEEDEQIDLAHESLMNGWLLFVEWQKEGRNLRLLRQRVEDALLQWQREQNNQNLMMGGLLAKIREDWQVLEPELNNDAKEFYHYSDAYDRKQLVHLREYIEEAIRGKAERLYENLPTSDTRGLFEAIQLAGLSLEKLQGEVPRMVKLSLQRAIQADKEVKIFRGSPGFINSVAFSSDSRHIISASEDRALQLWDCQGNLINRTFDGHSQGITSVAFSPDSRDLIVSGGYDHTLRLWDIDGKPIGKPFYGHEHSVWCVAFSPDGQRIASSSVDGTLRLWDLQANPVEKPFYGHEKQVWCVAFSPSGECIASGGADKTIRLWNLKGEVIEKPFQGHEEGINSIAFSPCGKYILSGSSDRTIRLWDLKGNSIGKPFRDFHLASVQSVAFSPDGQYIASGSTDEFVWLWNFQGNLVHERPLEGHEAFVKAVAFSPDGNYLLTGSSDQTIRLWLNGNWERWLQIACDRLRYHPVFKSPQTDVEKEACETCQKYVWNRQVSQE